MKWGESFEPVTPAALYARYLCSRDALGLKAEQAAGRPSAARDDRVSCIQPAAKPIFVPILPNNLSMLKTKLWPPIFI